MMILEPTVSQEQAENQRNELANALHGLLVAAGVINPDIPCDGPNLLMVAEEYTSHLIDNPETAPQP